jgi:hypothetical protein
MSSSGLDSKTPKRVPEWMERLGVTERNGNRLRVPLHTPNSLVWYPMLQMAF